MQYKWHQEIDRTSFNNLTAALDKLKKPPPRLNAIIPNVPMPVNDDQKGSSDEEEFIPRDPKRHAAPPPPTSHRSHISDDDADDESEEMIPKKTANPSVMHRQDQENCIGEEGVAPPPTSLRPPPDDDSEVFIPKSHQAKGLAPPNAPLASDTDESEEMIPRGKAAIRSRTPPDPEVPSARPSGSTVPPKPRIVSSSDDSEEMLPRTRVPYRPNPKATIDDDHEEEEDFIPRKTKDRLPPPSNPAGRDTDDSEEFIPRTSHPVPIARLTDIEALSTGGTMDSTFAKAVEAIIKSDIPPGVKDHIFTPPPEARNVMLRNICARYHAGTNSLAGYHCNIKPNDLNLDDYLHFPPDFHPPFSSSFTEQQLEVIHDQIVETDFENPSYQEKASLLKLARANQLTWELANINILSAIQEDLGSLEQEIRSLM